ncbi:hypothetical protein Q8G47_28465, partial [Klebsiella pneumoniae]|uniref:hypothetical protein n=1 Tax=Klebsiella pneumoniae TaxID=573 RepID=UPI0030135DBA
MKHLKSVPSFGRPNFLASTQQILCKSKHNVENNRPQTPASKVMVSTKVSSPNLQKLINITYKK